MRIGRLYLLHKFTIATHPELGPLLIRYAIVKCPWFAVCIHKLCRSDHDRALHDHPWAFLSLVLRGSYLEIHDNAPPNVLGRPLLKTAIVRDAGSIVFRPAKWRHRVVIEENRPAWTLILMGPRVRRWGFWTPGGWCWWRKYDADRAICEDEPIHMDVEN